jgi:hypothetical protein
MGDFEKGLLLGLLVNELHFGGDARQPQATLKMHSNRQTLFGWLHERLPDAKVYGPYTYTHKDGVERSFSQMMFRGKALTEGLVPLLDSYDWSHISPANHERYVRMKARFPRHFSSHD